jgi:hypothetical protein
LQRLGSRKDLGGWFVAALFVVFLLSIVVYRIASWNYPAVEAVAESPSTPLPAGPRRYDARR